MAAPALRKKWKPYCEFTLWFLEVSFPLFPWACISRDVFIYVKYLLFLIKIHYRLFYFCFMACQRPSAIEMGTMRFWHAVQALRMFRHTDNIVHLDNDFIFCFILWLKDTSDPLREDPKQKYAVKFTLISVNFHWEFSFLVSTFLGLAVGGKKKTKTKT